MTTEATMGDVAEALEMVMAGQGRSMDEGRIKTVALLILDQGWKRAELQQAARLLASSPQLRDTLRYGGTISPADFEQIRAGESRTVGEGEEQYVITTRTGFALKVARAKLYTFAEAMGLWKAAGEPGAFSDARKPDGSMRTYPDAMFSIVSVGEQTLWRLK